MNKEICPNCTSSSAFHDLKNISAVDCKTCGSTGVISSQHKQLLDWGFNEVSSPSGYQLQLNASVPSDGFSDDRQFVSIKIKRIENELELESFSINNKPIDKTVVDLNDAMKFCEKHF